MGFSMTSRTDAELSTEIAELSEEIDEKQKRLENLVHQQKRRLEERVRAGYEKRVEGIARFQYQARSIGRAFGISWDDLGANERAVWTSPVREVLSAMKRYDNLHHEDNDFTKEIPE